MPTQSLLDILKSTDLDELAQEIKDKEAARDSTIASLRAEIDALQLAHKLASVAQHGKPPKKPRQSPTRQAPTEPREAKPATGGGATQSGSIADRAYAFLRLVGSATPSQIAEEIKLANKPSIYPALQKDPRFKTEGNGVWTLS